MALDYFVNPLGGVNVGGALMQGMQLGSQLEDAALRRKQGEFALGQAERQEQMNLDNIGKLELRDNTIQFLQRLQATPPEQRQALAAQAIDDPSLDFDEEDLPLISNDQYIGAVLQQLGGAQVVSSQGDKVGAVRAVDIGDRIEYVDTRTGQVLRTESKGATPQQAQALTLKQLETQERTLDRQLARETNELKKQELEQKLANAKQEKVKAESQAKFEADNAIATFDNSLQTIDRIENAPGFNAAVGFRLPVVDSLPGGEAQEVIGLIETLQSQNFLNQIEKMKGLGALSNAEGEKVAAAIGSLNRDMSEKAFKRSLGQIREFLNKGKQAAMKKYGVDKQEQSNVIDWSSL